MSNIWTFVVDVDMGGTSTYEEISVGGCSEEVRG
jgi:hypothetical protein